MPFISTLGRFRENRDAETSTPQCVCIQGTYYDVDRVVAIAFELPKDKRQTCVDHINLNLADNRRSNLTWTSREDFIFAPFFAKEIVPSPHELMTEVWVEVDAGALT